MSIYGQSLMSRNNEIVTEGLLFLSNDAKSLKKEIQEKLKSEYTKGFINKIKNNVSSTSDFDKTKAQSALNFVMQKLENPIDYVLYVETVTTEYSTTYLYKQCIYGFYKTSFITIILLYDYNGASINSFKELKKSETIIPEDAIISILKAVQGKRYLASVSKNKISFSSLGREEKIDNLVEKAIEDISAKHPELEISTGKLFSVVTFKQK